jgi:class 3 adenylate cyclase
VITVTSFWSARETAGDLTEKVLSLAAGRTEDSARHLLSVATDEVNLDRALSTGGRIDPHDNDAISDYFVDYIGDAVMTFWNSPTRVEDHEFIACKTALENKRRIMARRPFRAERGWPPIGCRVGIHTGEAVVGNVGSNARLDFTAIGAAQGPRHRASGEPARRRVGRRSTNEDQVNRARHRKAISSARTPPGDNSMRR